MELIFASSTVHKHQMEAAGAKKRRSGGAVGAERSVWYAADRHGVRRFAGGGRKIDAPVPKKILPAPHTLRYRLNKIRRI